MHSIYLYSLGSVIVVSLISFVGIFTLSLKEDLIRKYISILVSLAVGGLLGDAFIHLIPEAFESGLGSSQISAFIIFGIIVFFILEKILHWHHHNTEGENEVPHIHPTGKMILVSDGIHNFIDGLIIAGSYMVSIEVGIATTLAVILHEIPQEIGDFAVLIHSGYTKTKALWLNFLSALSAILGAITAFIISGPENLLSLFLIPFTAGGFIYIALSDLIPELQKTKDPMRSFSQLTAVIFGIVIMFLLLFLE